jgi:hypothetical protein
MSPISVYLVNLVDLLRGGKQRFSIFKIGMVVAIAIFVSYLITLIIIGHNHL